MKWWMIVLFILFILIVLGSMILVPHNPAHNLILQYIYTLVSWPLIILVLGLVLLIKFKEPISERIRTLLIKTPKGLIIGGTAQIEAKPIEEEKIEEFKKKLEEERKIKKGYMEIADFERIIRQIYRSQYRLLKELKSKGSVLHDRIIFYYFEFVNHGGNKDYEIASYENWLTNVVGLIKNNKKNDKWIMKLTDRGNSFVDFCKFMKYPENIFIPL